MKKIAILVALIFAAAYALPSPVSAADPNDLAKINGISPRSIRKAQRKGAKAPKPPVNLSEVCRNVKPFSGALLKSAYPGHIQRTDPRASGFALVCASLCPRKFPAPAYYSDGVRAFEIGYYGLWEGNHRPRGYCAAGGTKRCKVDVVQKEAKKNGRDGLVYVDFGSGFCMTAVPGKRNGGV